MTRTPVVALKCFPPRLPFTWTAVIWLLLDRTHASGVACGVTWTLVAIVWITTVVGLFTTYPFDVLEKERERAKGAKP